MSHEYSPNCVFSSVEDIKGKRVTIMGLGLNGGGLAAVKFFLKHGALVTVTDMKTAEQLKPSIQAIEDDKSLNLENLTYHLGEHILEDFSQADCVIKNPGVKYEGNKYLMAAKNIESDLSIFLRFTKAPIIAVTGSKGKSSTVSSIYYGLKMAGFNCFLGGNITVSPLSFFDQVKENTPVVIEFSSWQLADLRGRNVLKPHISIITKIVPDHQNWYKAMKPYVDDKMIIYENQGPEDYAIFDAEDDPEGTGPNPEDYDFAIKNSFNRDHITWGDVFTASCKAKVLHYGLNKKSSDFEGVWQDKDEQGNFSGKIQLKNMDVPVEILKKLSVPGEHMKINVLNAALVLYLMGVESEKIIDILGSWSGIDHRLQYFHTWKAPNKKEYKFYNDSCATVPEAAYAASQSFGKSVILLTGGTDKGLELSVLEQAISNPKKDDYKISEVYFLEGSATQKITTELDKKSIAYKGPFNNLDSMLIELKKNIEKQETDKTTNINLSPEVIVFSPGATSFGMFTNEFDRGNKFMAKVKEIFN